MLRKFSTYKKRGEWVEQLLLAIVLGLGLNASRPIGDSACYDVIVEGRHGRLSRIQVKSASVACTRENLYRVACWRNGMVPYTARQIDYIAAFVIPEAAWYLIPVRKLRGKKEIFVKPSDPQSRFAEYRDAWRLLF